MKRIFSKKEKAENEVKVKKRFLNKKIYIAIMMILILLLISMLIFARSNGIKNFGDIKNFINDKLNSEEPKQASTFVAKNWGDVSYNTRSKVLDPKYSYSSMFAMEGSNVVDLSSDSKVKYKEKSDVHYFGALKNGKIKFKITKCAVDEDGNVCDVIVTVSKPTLLQENAPNPPNEFQAALDAWDHDYVGSDTDNRFRNVVSVSTTAKGYYVITFATLYARSDFTVQYVKTGTKEKAEIDNIFCTIKDIDVETDGHGGDAPFDGNECILLPQDLAGTEKVLYNDNKQVIKVKENHTYKGSQYNAVYRNVDKNYDHNTTVQKEKWWATAGIMLEGLKEKSNKGKFNIRYSGTRCGIKLVFDSPYVYDLPKPPKKKIWPGNNGQPKPLDPSGTIEAVTENEVAEGEVFRYAITQYIPNNRMVREIGGEWKVVNPPYDKFVIYDEIDEDLELAGSASDIKVRNEDNKLKTDYFEIDIEEENQPDGTKKTVVKASTSAETRKDEEFYGHYYTLIIPVKARSGLLDEKGVVKGDKKVYEYIKNGGKEDSAKNEASIRYRLHTR